MTGPAGAGGLSAACMLSTGPLLAMPSAKHLLILSTLAQLLEPECTGFSQE